MSALKTISLALKLSSLISGSLDLSPPARGVGAGELFGAAGDLVATAAGLDTAVAAGVTEGAGTTLAVGADVAVGAGGLDATEAAVGIGEGGDAAAGADAFGVGAWRFDNATAPKPTAAVAPVAANAAAAAAVPASAGLELRDCSLDPD